MLPVIAIVGRPNVGKSTLFNTLTQTRDAIVADVPGVTRDRQYGYGRLGPVQYVCIDTGGLVENPIGMDALMRIQTEHAIKEADRLIFVTDARAGLTTQDQFFARELRRSGKPVYLAVNKAEGLISGIAGADFHTIGLGEPHAISATHGSGCEELMEIVLAGLPNVTPGEQNEDGRIRIAVIGRPNVGKSTLINRLIGDERLITSEVAGTTRDSIFVPFERDGREFTMIDTAGVRRRAKIDDEIEILSVSKTLQAIAEAHVVTMVVDAQDSIGEQDASVLGLALSRGRALILAVNKWDNIPPEQREEIRRLLTLKIDFVPWAPMHFVSARHGTAVGDLVASMIRAYDAAMRQMKTPQLTKAMEKAMVQHPPRIIVHGSQAAHVPESYKRYLANMFRDEFDLFATPVSVEFRSDVNPFLKDKPKEKRGLKTSQAARRERRIKKDRAKRPAKKGGGAQPPRGAPRGRPNRPA